MATPSNQPQRDPTRRYSLPPSPTEIEGIVVARGLSIPADGEGDARAANTAVAAASPTTRATVTTHAARKRHVPAGLGSGLLAVALVACALSGLVTVFRSFASTATGAAGDARSRAQANTAGGLATGVAAADLAGGTSGPTARTDTDPSTQASGSGEGTNASVDSGWPRADDRPNGSDTDGNSLVVPVPFEEEAAAGFEIVVPPRVRRLALPSGFFEVGSLLRGRWNLWRLLQPGTIGDRASVFQGLQRTFPFAPRSEDYPFTVDEAVAVEAGRAYASIASRVILLLQQRDYVGARESVAYSVSGIDPLRFPEAALTESNRHFRDLWQLYDELDALVQAWRERKSDRHSRGE